MDKERRGLDMLLSQYRHSPNLKKYIKCFLDEFAEIQTQLEYIVKYRYLADSFGVMVDDIAYLVGASRTLYGAASLGFFGYYENPAAAGVGDDKNKTVGGFLRSDSDRSSADLVRTDPQLKNAIRARIIKTVTNCNIEDLLTFCDLVLGRELDLEIVEGKLKMEFIAHEILPTADRVLLCYMLPDIKPCGVSITLRDDTGNIALVFNSKDYPAQVI